MTQPPKPFTTDGCSGGMSWFWRTFKGGPPPWEGACVTHDRRYWLGGTAAERRCFDERLRAHIVGHGCKRLAETTFRLIRIFGHPYWPFPWRWGFGYRWPRGYR